MYTKHHIKDIGVAGVVFDKLTGDIISDFGAKRPRRERTLTNWLMIFHEGIRLMASDKELGLEAWRVFAYAVSLIDYDNRFIATQADIARGLEMKQQAVSRAFKLLTKKGIFIKGEKHGASKAYYLGTIIGNKGKAGNYQKKVDKELEFKDKRSSQNEIDQSSSSNLGESAA